MTKQSVGTSKLTKYSLIAASLFLVVGYAILLLEKTHVTNFYQKPVAVVVVDAPREVNNVDYTPESSPPDTSINSEKSNVETPPNQSQGSSTKNLDVVITRVNQDSTTKIIQVGILVNQSTTGTCTLELIQSGAVAYTDTASLIQQSSNSICAGFNVDASKLPKSGEYAVKVTVKSSDAAGSASQTETLVK